MMVGRAVSAEVLCLVHASQTTNDVPTSEARGCNQSNLYSTKVQLIESYLY